MYISFLSFFKKIFGCKRILNENDENDENDEDIYETQLNSDDYN